MSLMIIFYNQEENIMPYRKIGEGKRERLEGNRYGRLVVLSYEYDDKNRRPYYKCLCDCGKEKIIQGYLLKNNKTKSCGCIRLEAISKPSGEASFNALYSHYRWSAKKRGYNFNLSKENFKKLTSSDCFYCGEKPSKENRNGKSTQSPYIYNGIDRIDNTIGYEENNVVSCCEQCNKSKRMMSSKDFISWIKKVYEHQVNYARSSSTSFEKR
jgi:hypothetical protein